MASRAEYNKCMIPFLKDGKTKEQHRMDFCVGAKICSGKSKSKEEAAQVCQISLSQPKEPKSRKTRRATPAKGGMRLVLLTSTACKPCSAAKQYLKDKIDKGLIQELNVQTSDEAADLAAKYGFQSVPKLLVLDDEGVPFSELQVVDTEQTL